jgi:SAM-dependent methyltransferase
VTQTWDDIADWYADHIRGGAAMNDFAREILLGALPADLTGVRALDVGCGEGIITRALAARGASAVGIDPTETLIAYAQEAGGDYHVDDGATLATIPTASVDLVTAGLSINNIPDLSAALAAAARVLVPGGLLAFTVPHPCFEAPHSTWTDRAATVPEAQVVAQRRIVGDYLDEGFWRSGNPQGVRRAGNHHRKIETYVTAMLKAGYTIKSLAEPTPNKAVATAQPQRAALPPFLLLTAQPRT